jgi:UDP-GlcNAc:undecaprenyl-phosphate/decaprenyl-phosphate GlcNAc-1-phosphate transferase
MSSSGPSLLVFAIASALSALLVPVSKRLAMRFRVLDAPGPRKVHAEPTPRLGGVAVFVAFTTVVLAGYLLRPILATLPAAQSLLGPALDVLQEAYKVQGKLVALGIGSVIAFAVGFTDDVMGARFPARVKAVGQIFAALVLIAADVRTSFLPYEWMNIVVTLVWLVGITNAFNLLDNMDGLCAGVAFVASGVLLINAVSRGELFISLILVAFMGSLLGFLVFNWNPASVFLGDCGSHFIGFLMGSLTLLDRYVGTASSTLFPVLMPVLVLAIPILDTATVVFIRLREGRPIYVGDRRHLSHRLEALGLSTRVSVLVIYLATFCLGLGAATLADATVGETVLILIQSAGFVALILVLMFVERHEAPGEEPRQVTP